MQHIFCSNTRDYNDWTIEPNIIGDFNPLSHKLFHNDVFTYSESNIHIIHSNVRTFQHHCGVLVLQGNKTYGKASKGRMYYKCIPNDRTLPVFLIPYELKIGFSKNHLNKYVTFKFVSWEQKHPYGCLTESFGNVDNFASFCTYQLWTKQLVYSISSLQKQVKSGLKQMNEEKLVQYMLESSNYKIDDKRTINVYSIDPYGSKDLDDAFSIHQINETQLSIGIYIANVALMLDCYNLWEHLTSRVSTIYLHEERHTMLPEILSDNLCSLLENKDRFAFTMEFVFDTQQKTVLEDSILFYNSLVNVKRNYVYEEEALLINSEYNRLFQITQTLDCDVHDSHDVVSYWMIYMNSQCAKQLYLKQCGVFRKMEIKTHKEHAYIGNKELQQTLSLWNNVASNYVLYNNQDCFHHDLLKVDSYVQITSPIRRLVDVMNQIYFLSNILHISFENPCIMFMEKMEQNIERINQDMKSIRKVQSECDLLYMCIHNEELMNSNVDGFIIDKVLHDNLYHYVVYIQILKKITYFKHSNDLPIHSFQTFKLFLFDRENNGHRKIRLMLQ